MQLGKNDYICHIWKLKYIKNAVTIDKKSKNLVHLLVRFQYLICENGSFVDVFAFNKFIVSSSFGRMY